MCCYVFPQNCPFPLWDRVLHLTHHMVPMAKRHLDRFSCFCMGPKCCAVQCVVSGEENPKTVPSARDFVTLPDEDRPTAIGNMHRKTGKDCTCGMEISLQTDRRACSSQYFATASVGEIKRPRSLVVHCLCHVIGKPVLT